MWDSPIAWEYPLNHTPPKKHRTDGKKITGGGGMRLRISPYEADSFVRAADHRSSLRVSLPPILPVPFLSPLRGSI